MNIAIAKTASEKDLTEYSAEVLRSIGKEAGEESILITSMRRMPRDQARIMFENIVRHGVDYNLDLYGDAGDVVVRVYEERVGPRVLVTASSLNVRSAAATSSPQVGQVKSGAMLRVAGPGGAGWTSVLLPSGVKGWVASDFVRLVAPSSRDEVIDAMAAKIIEVGAEKISHHCADPRVLNVIDVAPSSVKHHAAFARAVRAEERVSKFIAPPADPAFHIEIPQRKGAST